MCKKVLSLVACCLVVLVSQLTLAADHAFVDDFQAFELSPGWKASSLVTMMVDDNNVVTVFSRQMSYNPVFQNDDQVYFRRFDQLGNPLCPITLISDSSAYSLNGLLSVNSNRNGKWVVCQEAFIKCPEVLGCAGTLMAFVSTPDGSTVDTSFEVGTEVTPTYLSMQPCTAVDSAGNYLIAWERGGKTSLDTMGIMYQLYDSNNLPKTGILLASDGPVSDGTEIAVCRLPQAAMAPNGNFAIVWQAECVGPACQPQTFPFVYMRLFNADGSPKTQIIRVDDIREEWPDQASHPDIAMADDGRVAVAYSRLIESSSVTGHPVIKRFDADGNPLGSEIFLDSIIQYEYGTTITVACDSAFNLIITWDNQSDGYYTTHFNDIYTQRIDSNGNFIGPRYRINDLSQFAGRFTSGGSLNNSGLAGFCWHKPNPEPSLPQLTMMQLMDYSQVGIYIPGDANNSTSVSIADAVFLINYIFGGGYSPATTCIADANGDGSVSIGDAVTIVNYIFAGGKIDGDCSQ